jgi:hypothetical protein
MFNGFLMPALSLVGIRQQKSNLNVFLQIAAGRRQDFESLDCMSDFQQFASSLQQGFRREIP